MLTALIVVELFRFLKNKKVGYIKMPDTVPPALVASFEALAPVMITVFAFSLQIQS